MHRGFQIISFPRSRCLRLILPHNHFLELFFIQNIFWYFPLKYSLSRKLLWNISYFKLFIYFTIYDIYVGLLMFLLQHFIQITGVSSNLWWHFSKCSWNLPWIRWAKDTALIYGKSNIMLARESLYLGKGQESTCF